MDDADELGGEDLAGVLVDLVRVRVCLVRETGMRAGGA